MEPIVIAIILTALYMVCGIGTYRIFIKSLSKNTLANLDITGEVIIFVLWPIILIIAAIIGAD